MIIWQTKHNRVAEILASSRHCESPFIRFLFQSRHTPPGIRWHGGIRFLIGCSSPYKQHFVDDCYTNTALLRAAEPLAVGGIICRASWRGSLGQRPWLTMAQRFRCGVWGGFWRHGGQFLLRDASCEILNVKPLRSPSVIYRSPHKT